MTMRCADSTPMSRPVARLSTNRRPMRRWDLPSPVRQLVRRPERPLAGVEGLPSVPVRDWPWAAWRGWTPQACRPGILSGCTIKPIFSACMPRATEFPFEGASFRIARRPPIIRRRHLQVMPLLMVMRPRTAMHPRMVMRLPESMHRLRITIRRLTMINGAAFSYSARPVTRDWLMRWVNTAASAMNPAEISRQPSIPMV